MKKNKLLSAIIYPEFFKMDKMDRVLNLGCGIGPQAIIYKDQYKEMVGVDINKERLELANQIMNVLDIQNFQTLHSNVEDIALPDKSFDKIIAIDIVEHLINPDKFLQEARRLLKDNGLLLITFPAMHDKFIDVCSFISKKILRRKSKKEVIKGWDPDEHQYDHSIKEWFKMIEENGFYVEKSRASTTFPPLHYYGVPKFWFKNKMIHRIDRFFCELPILKNYGQAMVCICKKLNKKMAKKTHADHLLKHVPNLLKFSILDIGSGRGDFLIDVARQGGKAIGIEINDAYIKETLDKAAQDDLRVKVIKGVAENLPFNNDIFDFINFALVIEHIEDPEKAIKEIARVMKINGQAYLGVPNRFSFKDPHFHLYFVNWLPRFMCNRFITIFGKHKDYNGPAGRQNLREMHYYTFSQIKKLLVANGFEVVDIKEKKLRKIFKNSLICLPFILLYKIYSFFFLGSFNLLLKKVN
ncbi:MAG: methyltransferase domain-containing protein [Candidatus Margulisbacteria bacterium]|nr:methyltransferase domain-containing protein [Candidatus Margulisiibacteriota bacterium]